MKSAWLVAATFLIACGDDAAAEPELDGQWYFESDSQACGYGLYLNGSDYEQTTVCELTSGELAAETEAGTFTEDGSRITFAPNLSSCAGASAKPLTVSYDFKGENLRVTSPAGVFLFERLTGEGNSGRVTFGCFDANGLFAPMPVEPI